MAHRVVALAHAEDLYPAHRHSIKDSVVNTGPVEVRIADMDPHMEMDPDGAGVAHRVVALTHAEDLYPAHRHAIKDTVVNKRTRRKVNKCLK